MLIQADSQKASESSTGDSALNVPMEHAAGPAEKPKEAITVLGFPDFFIEYRSKSGMERREDWNRAMAAEIKAILTNLDANIVQAEKNGYKEAQIMRVGAELVRPGNFGRLPKTQMPSLNDRHTAVFEALKQQPGIETELKKDANNVYWIVARHKR